MPVPVPAKRAAIVAAALLLGAPTAGAALRSGASAPALADGLLKIEYVVPPEPELHPAYPLETLDEAPPNEFKRPPRAPRWGYGFAGMEAAMWAEAPGVDGALEPSTSMAELHSSYEPASGFLDE